jgi:hypothetical protein
MGVHSTSFEIDELRSYAVKILRADGRVGGTGFFCRPDGLVLTCRHVVESVGKNGPNGEIDLIWHTSPLRARFRADLTPDKSDLAVYSQVRSDVPLELLYI